MTDALRDLLGEIAGAAPEARLFLVGGAVRDLLRSEESRDVDLLVLPGSPPDLVSRLARRPGWNLAAAHPRFGTATLSSASGLRVDLALARTESYPEPGGLPAVTVGASLEEDLARRDFTIHAMAMKVLPGGALGPAVDPFGGTSDLVSRSLRLLHLRSLRDDPTRALRAVRYEARLGFRVAQPGFSEALERSRLDGAWNAISGDRLRNSLEEILAEPRWIEALDRLQELGVARLVDPGWTSAPVRGADVERIEDRWRILFDPLGPAVRPDLADRLRFSRRLRRETGAVR